VTLTELGRDEEGRAAVSFRAPNGSVSIACRYDEPIRFLQVFSGDTLASHRRHGLALEPYTCAPDAFNNRLGLIRLEPGAAVAVRWSVGAE